MAFAWSDEYTLGIDVIDTQHKQFVGALSDLIQALGSGSGKDVVASVFDRISQYATYHFETEERYFDQFSYEGATEHKEKHAEFKKEFAKIKTDYLTNHLEATFNLADFLENWLLDHLMNMDKKYVACFKEHGL